MPMMHTVTHLDAGDLTLANMNILCYCLINEQEIYLWPCMRFVQKHASIFRQWEIIPS